MINYFTIYLAAMSKGLIKPLGRLTDFDEAFEALLPQCLTGL